MAQKRRDKGVGAWLGGAVIVLFLAVVAYGILADALDIVGDLFR